MDIGKGLSKMLKYIKKYFIDIRFLSILALVLLFLSLIVVVNREGNQNINQTQTVVGTPEINMPSASSTETTVEPEQVENNDVELEDATDIVCPKQCSDQCPNKEMSCLTSKPACINCLGSISVNDYIRMNEEIKKTMSKKEAPAVEINMEKVKPTSMKMDKSKKSNNLSDDIANSSDYGNELQIRDKSNFLTTPTQGYGIVSDSQKELYD